MESIKYLELNAKVKGQEIDLEADRQAVRSYFLDHVNRNLYSAITLREKLSYMVNEGYYKSEVIDAYKFSFIKKLRKYLENKHHRFPGLIPALKFYKSYALKTYDGQTYLERYEDRILITALELGGGDEIRAWELAEEMIEQRFQPATPTFTNTGRRNAGKFVSCFLLNVGDSLNDIYKITHAAAKLSQAGGGVGLNFSDVRAEGDPVQGRKGLAASIIRPIRQFDVLFPYVNQGGTRPGAGVAYLHAHHLDIQAFLNSKRENADEGSRIQNLSMGVLVPDITLELAKNDENMYLFSPYDASQEYGVPFSEIDITAEYRNMVENPNIRKRHIKARDFFTQLAEIQFNSGYPYVIYIDNANKVNPIAGKIKMSNLCVEIMQVQEPSTIDDTLNYLQLGKDISCNLGSLNIKATMESPNFGKTIEVAIRALTEVSDTFDMKSVPTVDSGNRRSHAIGLGQMNLHGYLASKHIEYGSPEALAFIDTYAMMVTYHAINTSMIIARERGETFDGFENSKYADGSYFDEKYHFRNNHLNTEVAPLFEGHYVPRPHDWAQLKEDVMKYGMYNQNLQAIPPTGSISYVNNSVPSILPVTAKVETREEGKLGRVNYPAPGISKDTFDYYKDAYELGNKAIIDTAAAFQEHVDQGISMTLFFKDTDTTEDINRYQNYAWSKGIKSIYYVRIKKTVLDGTDIDYVECESCSV
jgi:ribonucleoside-diphosphate reductase alpha chain